MELKSLPLPHPLSPREAVRAAKHVRQVRREKKVYSGLDYLPEGRASDVITPGCLVLEGGAFRGLYTLGVLDLLMQKDLNFQTTIGVSAGALSGMNYVSGQIGRGARANLGHRHDSDFIGAKALRKSHSILRLDYLLKDYQKIDSLDDIRFYDPSRRFIAVATNLRTGTTEYCEKGICPDITAAVKASASIPFLSPPVMVDGEPCLDGGCSCKIPYQWALDHRYRKIVVVRTREREFRKQVHDRHTAEKIYSQYPYFAETLDHINEAYNHQCDHLEDLSNSGRIFIIEPSDPVRVSRIESDMEKLGELYWLGYRDAMNQLEALQDYLNS